jgi:hypothetical protein
LSFAFTKKHITQNITTKYGNNLSGWIKAWIIMLGYENKETDGHRILTIQPTN